MWRQHHCRSCRGWTSLAALALAGTFAGAGWCDPPWQKSLPAARLLVAQAGGLKSDSVIKVSASADKPDARGNQVVTVTMKIDKGWHAYANPVKNEQQEGTQTTVQVTGKTKPLAVKIMYPAGELMQDKDVGNYMVYTGQVAIKAAIQRSPGDTGPLELSVKFMACNDKTCLVPATVKLTVP